MHVMVLSVCSAEFVAMDVDDTLCSLHGESRTSSQNDELRLNYTERGERKRAGRARSQLKLART